jgi:hypothetical protein
MGSIRDKPGKNKTQVGSPEDEEEERRKMEGTRLPPDPARDTGLAPGQLTQSEQGDGEQAEDEQAEESDLLLGQPYGLDAYRRAGAPVPQDAVSLGKANQPTTETGYGPEGAVASANFLTDDHKQRVSELGARYMEMTNPRMYRQLVEAEKRRTGKHVVETRTFQGLPGNIEAPANAKPLEQRIDEALRDVGKNPDLPRNAAISEAWQKFAPEIVSKALKEAGMRRS